VEIFRLKPEVNKWLGVNPQVKTWGYKFKFLNNPWPQPRGPEVKPVRINPYTKMLIFKSLPPMPESLSVYR
jgi:hypothetical protein